MRINKAAFSIFLIIALLQFAASAHAQPIFSKAFDSESVAVGGITTLTFTIDNSASGSVAGNLQFQDNFPSGLVVADPPSVNNTCTGGVVLASGGASGVGYVGGGSVGAGASCTISVDIEAVSQGMKNNVSNDLVSTLGNSGPATDDILVTLPPLFSKAFDVDSIPQGGISTLTFTIDNTASTASATNLFFGDTLPDGLVIADPPAVNKTCTGGVVAAAAGKSGFTYQGGGSVAAGASCTISVDIEAVSQGMKNNVSTDLTSSSGNSGPATDDLLVRSPVLFSKAFAVDVITVGGTTTLTFTIDNSGGALPATDLAFFDNLPDGLPLANSVNAVNNCSGTLLAGGGKHGLTYSGGSVAAGATCTVSVDVEGLSPGLKTNISGDLTSSLGNSGPATDDITVVPLPVFSKAFAVNALAVGDTTTLTFTIDNSGSIVAATDLAFMDTMPDGMRLASPDNDIDNCSGTLQGGDGKLGINYFGGSVAAGASCTISVDVLGETPGIKNNISTDLTSSLGNSGPATDDLRVYEPPLFSKFFADDPLQVDQTTILRFDIDNTANPVRASNLSFTDTLPDGMEIAPGQQSTNCPGSDWSLLRDKCH